MLAFHEPIFNPKKPNLPTVEGDETAEQKAAGEARRRARAALASGGRQGSILAGGAPPASPQRKSVLGF